MSQFERRKKFHQRSRRGCLTCRQRRVRCDEAKPQCANCVRLNRTCSYDAYDPFVVVTDSTYRSLYNPPSPTNAAPNHLLVGIPVELDRNSRRLFRLFMERRLSRQATSTAPGESFVIRRALVEPGYLHVSIILGCMDSLWLGEPFENFKVPFLHHRGEAYRVVREELPLKKRTKDVTEYTIATISILAALEGTFNGRDGFNLNLLVLHIRGIQNLLSLCPRHLPWFSPMQCLIKMAINDTSGDDILDQLPVFIRSHHAIVSAIYFPKPAPVSYYNSSGPDDGASSTQQGSLLRSRGVIWSPETSNVKEDSQIAFLVSFLYIYAKLPMNALSSYMVNWIIEVLLEALDKTESAVLEGTFDGKSWLWMCVFGISAAASVCLRNHEDLVQMMLWKPLFDNKIRWISGVLKIEDWTGARQALEAVRWDEGFNGEDEIRRLWEGAMSTEP